MSFASDTFTGTQFTELATYSGSWSKQTGYAGDLILGAGGTYVIRNDGTTPGCYQHSASPASADYSVFADIAKLSGFPSPHIGVIGRAAAAAQTFYLLRYVHGSTALRLDKVVSGSVTQLGSSYTMTLTSTPVNIELRMAGGQISGYVNGVLRIGPVTDTAITAAGKAGIYGFDMRETGVADAGSIDNFNAVNAAAASDLSGGVTLDAVAPAGTLGLQPGVITTAPWRAPVTGAVLASTTIPKITVLRISDMAQVLTLTDQTTNGSGVLTISNAALLQGVPYLLVACNADGTAFGAEAYTAT